jgi:hypothetical protein
MSQWLGYGREIGRRGKEKPARVMIAGRLLKRRSLRSKAIRTMRGRGGHRRRERERERGRATLPIAFVSRLLPLVRMEEKGTRWRDYSIVCLLQERHPLIPASPFLLPLSYLFYFSSLDPRNQAQFK